jgi:hypothetical protein
VRGEHIRLATVLAASAAFLAACDRQICNDEHSQRIACDTTGHGSGFHGGFGGGDDGAVARGGFGGTGGGGEGGGGE